MVGAGSINREGFNDLGLDSYSIRQLKTPVHQATFQDQQDLCLCVGSSVKRSTTHQPVAAAIATTLCFHGWAGTS